MRLTKKLFILLVLFIQIFFVHGSVYAQEETLFESDVESGYFAGPVFKITEVNNRTSYMIGGRGGWIVNRKYTFGLGAYGLISAVGAPAETRIEYNSPKLKMEYNYGGFEFVYIINSDNLIHYNLYSLFGLGSIELYSTKNINQHNDSFFVFEPAINVIVNVNPMIRIGMGISYRILSGIDTYGIESSDISGIGGTITIKLGNF
ncbi:hypothetical protein ACFL6H_03595 [Candidatus Latescibacterota bacterium]